MKLCTSNKCKAAEVARILAMPVEPVKVVLDEIQAIDPVVVSRAKAAQAFRELGVPVIVDDTALCLDGLNGFPGALIAWVLDSGGLELIHRMLPPGAEKGARAVTVICYADEGGVEAFVGEVAGEVIAAPRGENGFGFDAVFVPAGQGLTFAEMASEAKDHLSPRGQALRQLAAFLARKKG
ncbi:non-canonical purine NTP pyrophosphatase [Caulobacter sp. SL161]|nr:non-canonical purine NTP pyrophosphatase [Caulobacter sp. SL161]